MGVLLDEMRSINRQIITNGGYETEVSFSSNPDKTDPVIDITVNCNIMYHNTIIDPETGAEISGTQISLLVNTQELIDLGYPVYRNSETPNDPDILYDKVTFIDSNSKTHVARIIIQRPDLTFGCITAFLEQYAD